MEKNEIKKELRKVKNSKLVEIENNIIRIREHTITRIIRIMLKKNDFLSVEQLEELRTALLEFGIAVHGHYEKFDNVKKAYYDITREVL